MKKISLFSIFTAALLLSLGLWFGVSVSRLEQGQSRQGQQQLADAIRRAAVACYAAEGRYPADLSYLQTHYGIQINDTQYTVFYRAYGENIMPEITVLEKK